MFQLALLALFLLGARGDDSLWPKCDPKQTPADIVFIIESSAQIGYHTFKAEVATVMGFLHELSIGQGPTDTRVAFINMGKNPFSLGPLTQYQRQADVVMSLIRDMNYTASEDKMTDMIYRSLQLVNARFQNSPRDGVPKILVVFSREKFSCTRKGGFAWACEEARKLKKSGVIVSTVQVKVHDGDSNAENKAADPTGDSLGDKRYDFVSDESLMDNLAEMICTVESHARPCDCNPENLWLDMVFVIDSGEEIGVEDFDGEKSLVMGFAEALKVSQQRGQYSRFGIVNAGATADIVGKLPDFKSSAEVSKALMNMKYKGGVMNLHAALSAANEIVRSAKTQHPNVRKAIVLFAGTVPDCAALYHATQTESDFCRLAGQILDDEVTIIAVQWKRLEDPLEESMKVNSTTGNVMQLLKNSDKVAEEMFYLLCQANCYCPRTLKQVKYHGTSYGDCLYLEEVPAGYYTAQQSCKMQDMKMAVIQNKEKEQILYDMALKAGYDSYFVGLEKYDKEYLWNESEKLVHYFNFDRSQPAALGRCALVKVKPTPHWYIVPCSYVSPAAHYFCERDTCDTANYCATP